MGSFLFYKKLFSSPYYWLLWALIIACCFSCKKGYDNAETTYQEKQQAALMQAIEDNQDLQAELNQLTNERMAQQSDTAEKVKPTVKEIIKYVEAKARDSPCFITLDAVGMLDNLCQKTGDCSTGNTL